MYLRVIIILLCILKVSRQAEHSTGYEGALEKIMTTGDRSRLLSFLIETAIEGHNDAFESFALLLLAEDSNEIIQILIEFLKENKLDRPLKILGNILGTFPDCAPKAHALKERWSSDDDFTILENSRDDEFELIEDRSFKFYLWSASNSNINQCHEFSPELSQRHSSCLVTVPVLYENQMCFCAHQPTKNEVIIPKYYLREGISDLFELWAESFVFNNEGLDMVILHINQETKSGQLFKVNCDKDTPLILVFRVYHDSPFLSLIEGLASFYQKKHEQIFSFGLEIGDLIVFIPANVKNIFKELIDLVGVFSEYSTTDPVASFNEVRLLIQMAAKVPVKLTALLIK